MSNDVFGYRFLRNAGLVGTRGLWLGVGIGAATVLAVTALARKGVRKVAACTDKPGEAEIQVATAAEPAPESSPVRAVKAARKPKAKAQDVPVRAVRAKRQPKAEAKTSEGQPEVQNDATAVAVIGEPAAKPAPKRKRAAKPAEPSSQP